MEIERKWLLRTLPMRPANRKYWIEQFYISTEPEIRLRRCMPNGNYENEKPFVMTYKGNGSLSREEVETAVSEDFYEKMRDIVDLDPIQKHFLTYDDIDGHMVEISVILNDEKFVYAEVEFQSEDEANAYQFPWPELVVEEVTDNPDYKMKNYWKRIRSL